MKAMTYHKADDQFVLADLPMPELETEFDVLVKVHAVGLNPVDAKVHLWHGMVPDMDDHFVGGLDVSGEICAVGAQVEGWKIGDRVLYHGNMRRQSGGFAQYSIHDFRTLLPHPNVSAVQAAATPCAAWTAYRALQDKLNIERRSSILITGGAGGVGSFALQMARHFGVETIITTCSAKNRDYVLSLGATHAVDYHQDNTYDAVMAITDNQGVEVALDCVGGDNDMLSASVLAFEGELVELVKTVNPEQYPDAFLKGLSFHQLSLGSGHVNGEKGWNSILQAGRACSELLETGHIRVPNLTEIGLDQIGDALVQIRQQRTVGKVVARIV